MRYRDQTLSRRVITCTVKRVSTTLLRARRDGSQYSEESATGTKTLLAMVIEIPRSTYIVTNALGIFQASDVLFSAHINNKVKANHSDFQTRSAKPIRPLPISQAVYVFRRKTSPRIQNSVARSALSLGLLEARANLPPVSSASQDAPARHSVEPLMGPRLNVSGEILISFPPT